MGCSLSSCLPQKDGSLAQKVTFLTVAQNLVKASKLLVDLTLTQFALGLYFLYKRHVRTGVKDAIEGQAPALEDLVDLLVPYKWVSATYAGTVEEVCALGEFAAGDVVKHKASSEVHRPAYFIAVAPASKAVVFGVRGTQSLADVVTDLESTVVPFKGGDVHQGMYDSASHFMEEVVPMLAELMAANEGFRLHIVGHSLGAGTAACFTLLLVNDPGVQARIPGSLVRCTALACPACMTADLGESLKPHVTSIVFHDDIIPRLCVANVHMLQIETIFTNWEEDLENGTLKKETIRQLSNAQATLTKTLQKTKEGLFTYVNALYKSNVQGVLEAYKPLTKEGQALKDLCIGQITGHGVTHGNGISLHFAPGRLLHFTRRAAAPGGDPDEHFAVVSGGPGQLFRRIILSPTMIKDHGLLWYNKSLNTVCKELGGEMYSDEYMGLIKDKFKDEAERFARG